VNQPSGDTGPLPVNRAFVVQLHADAAVGPERFAGRVEHVASGQSTHVDILADFLTFVARALADLRAEPAVER
jgi:hypothetical protein